MRPVSTRVATRVMKTFTSFVVVLLSLSSQAADLTPAEMAAAQVKANQHFSYNQLVSGHVSGDVILSDNSSEWCKCVGPGCQRWENCESFDYQLHQDREGWEGRGPRYLSTFETWETYPGLTQTIQNCMLTQASQFARLNELRPEFKAFFKLLRFDSIEVYENALYRPTEGPSDFQELGYKTIYFINFKTQPATYFFQAENVLDLKMDLVIHLDRSQPCDFLSAEMILARMNESRTLPLGSVSIIR